MTAWTRAGRTTASPSRLARSVPPLRGCGLDRLSPARRGLAKRSRFEMSASTPSITALPGRRRVLWDKYRLFALKPYRAMLAGCPVRAPAWASCPTTFTSRRSLGPVSADRRSMISRLGPSRTIGPSACLSRKPRWTYSRHGSAIFSTRCSRPADDLSGALP
jgi:hypothetical protein